MESSSRRSCHEVTDEVKSCGMMLPTSVYSGSPAGELAPQVTEGFSINLMKLQPLRHGFAVPRQLVK